MGKNLQLNKSIASRIIKEFKETDQMVTSLKNFN